METSDIRVLEPSNHLCQFDVNCGKIQYVSDPLKQTGLYFLLNIKTFSCTRWSVQCII